MFRIMLSPEDKVDFKQSLVYILSRENIKHYFEVLKIKSGEQLELLFSDADNIFLLSVTVKTVQKKEICLVINNHRLCNAPSPKITVFQCIPKAGKLEYIVQKAAELGASRLVLVASKRCIGKIEDSKKIERYQKIALEAAMQSKAEFIMEVSGPIPIEEVSHQNLLIFYEEQDRTISIRHTISRLKSSGINEIGILIGPEGGLDESDLHKLDGVLVSLGNQILRTETASLFALSCIKYEYEY